jgi:hypothetical protein
MHKIKNTVNQKNTDSKVLMMVYNTWNYWVFGLCSSSDILKNFENLVRILNNE